jgi:imidazolonepropionase-like amidohydrolase
MKRKIHAITLTIALSCFATFCFVSVAQSQITEKPGFGKYAITGADVYTVTNGVIEGGTVVIDGKTISYVGEDTDIGDEYTQIDASGKRVYPGFIDSGTGLGLLEISAVPVTNDQNEVGEFNPHVMAFTAINPHSAAIPVTRTSGVTTVISAPGSGIISGKAALIDLYGNSPDSMAVLKEAGLVHDWPSSGRSGWWDDRDEDEIEKAYKKDLKEIKDYWKGAIAYNRMMNAYDESSSGKREPDSDVQLEAMQEVLAGEVPVILYVNEGKDIIKALGWIEKMQEETDARFILAGVAEGWTVADEIAEAEIHCLVGPVLSVPSEDHMGYQAAYQNAGKLLEAGVKVALMTQEVENVRNLPFNAGFAATYGMGIEEALKAITITPAEIFGVEDRLGSIEEGKLANLFIADGDPFEPMNHVEQVFIEGFKIPMTNRHRQLYEQFLDRDATTEE